MIRSTVWLRDAPFSALRSLGVAAGLVAGLALASSAAAGTVRFAGEGHAENPVWSPDGTYVAFEVNRFAGDTEMFVAELSGDIAREAKKVTLPGGGGGFGSGNQVTINPTWAKGGTMLFEGSNQGGQFRIYYASPTSPSASEMIEASAVSGDLTFPHVSPDGMRIVFVSDRTGNGDIREYNNSNQAVTQLTSTEGSEMFPRYSGDGTQVLFTRKRNNVEAIYLLDIASGQETTVSSGNADRTRPTFAGDRIAYFAANGDDWDLVSVDMQGQNRQTLGRNVRLPVRGRPQVTPDGRYVAYTSADPTKSGSVMLARADGSASKTIPTGFVAAGEPAVTVQGTRTLLAFTALPDADASWRFLHVIDITGQL